MKQSALETKIFDIIRPAVEDMGFSLRYVRVSGDSRGRVVQVTAEDPRTRRLGIDDCTAITRTVSALLDLEDPVEGKYMLEVSSPGIDRMLCTPADYEEFSGFEVKIELADPLEGRRRFRGVLQGLEDGGETIVLRGEETYRLPVASVGKAKPVLTDELIKTQAGKNTGKETQPKEEER